MKTITVINQKGGVAKSTTAQTIAAILSKKKGKRILFVEMDPQGSSTRTFKASVDDATIAEALTGSMKIKDTIQQIEYGDMIPADIALAGINDELKGTGRNQRLRKLLEQVSPDYDYCIIDTPPNLGICTILALFAADQVIVPAQASTYSLDGVDDLKDTIDAVKRNGNPDLEVAGILLTSYEGRLKHSAKMRAKLNDFSEKLNTKVFDTVIRRSVKVDEAQDEHTSIIDYAPNNNVSRDYIDFVDELLGEK